MKVDVVVVGAGIQGVGIAQAAAAAGYSVLVIEKTAVAHGTSSKSSKLIHGGLRYLESFQFSLVRESLQERALLLKLAPDLVSLKPLHIPIYEHSTRSALTIRTGLSLYALLGGLSSDSRFSSIPSNQFSQLAHLRKESLQSVFRYFEAQTDDAALTRAVLASAQRLGASVEVPAEVVAIERTSDGVEVTYTHDDQSVTVSCHAVFNCSGPWVEKLIDTSVFPVESPNVELVQGSHLLLPPVLDTYFYLESPRDRRAIFVLPWKGRVLLGTTETIYTGDPEQAACTPSERDYLMETFTYYFPDIKIPEASIESFAGLRVLPKSEKSAFNRSRDVILSVDNKKDPRILSVVGGKLTTYRATALDALARLESALPARKAIARTSELPLYPAD